MQQESALFGKRTNMWSNLGLGNLTADPEVELMKMKMQMAEDYYAFVFKNSRNKQLLDEADKARQEAELAYVTQKHGNNAAHASIRLPPATMRASKLR